MSEDEAAHSARKAKGGRRGFLYRPNRRASLLATQGVWLGGFQHPLDPEARNL